jgi:HK97 family phage major capsid protein
MLNNRTLLEKADLALSDLLSGGVLVDAQAQKFIRLLIKESKVLGMATVRPMKSTSELVEKIRFGSRILRAGQSATPLALADRAKPDLSKVSLAAKLMKGQVNLDDETLEDNIEQGSLRQTVMELMGEAIARDIDELLVQGDTASSDPFLALFNGMLKAATSNVVEANQTAISRTLLKNMIKAMPSEFIRNKRNLRILTSVDAETDLRETYAGRETALGDRNAVEDDSITFSGIPVESVPLFPENLGGGTNETNAILVDPKNLLVGMWRKIRVETDKDIEAGVLKIVTSLRADFKYMEETAVVKATEITVS